VKIHQVKTRLVNSYVVEYDNKLAVIDVAVRTHRYVLGFIEQELKRDITEVKLVTCTHDDPDHIGGIFALAGLCHAQVAIPYASQTTFRKIANDPTGGLVRTATGIREAFRRRSWKMYLNRNRDRAAKNKPKFMGNTVQKKRSRLKTDSRLKHLDLLPNFKDWSVIHTPGHSWDSCCFYHAQSQSLITGDTLLGSGKKLVSPSIYANSRQTQESLKRLRALKITTVYPGHGSIINGAQSIINVGE
jgi:glyoxylase-like metal-dependent hydrolase (beta-lactamase superfamily II)